MLSDWFAQAERLIAKWRYARKHDECLKSYGWDGKCSCCGRWYHTDEAAVCVATGVMHWDYWCMCGNVDRLALYSILPMTDNNHEPETPRYPAQIELAEV